MTLKYHFGESLEAWTDRVQKYEYGYALQRLAKGESPDMVMEDMARRISQKFTHAVLVNFKSNQKIDYDAEQSRRSYEENYVKRIGRRADHVYDERFMLDNPTKQDL